MENTNCESNLRWEKIADFWDSHTQNGNEFYHQLVAPMALQLLQVQPHHEILEIACSSGLFSRELAKTAHSVLGIDVSSRFISLAKERSVDLINLDFRQLDATSLKDMEALGRERFNLSVCNMALMDISDITSIFRSLKTVLRKDSAFVATLLHPCFNSPDLNFFVEQSIRDNQVVKTQGLKISHYLSPIRFEQMGILGQPIPHFYFHRPLNELLRPAFQNGFVLDALEEVTLPPQNNRIGQLLDRSNFPEIPAVLGLRFRLLT
jgi:2-polyprenyl-3-methyl-5-hydroxy-6-metoxy-1,4-benzoquinol methylase